MIAGVFDVFDPLLDFIGSILSFFYDLVPDYSVSIVLLTILLMIVTSPLTLKGTRGMIKMQLLQPELKKIQEKHRGGDRNAMNQELMEFYQSNNLNPLGGCLPLLIQMPFFLMMYNVVRGITSRSDGLLAPKHLPSGGEMFESLNGATEMLSLGIDLSRSASDALGDSIVEGLPYLALVIAMIAAQYFQQKQISARNLTGQDNPQQKILQFMPLFFGVISINFPAALVIYWVASNLYRIGLQAYITRSLYGHDEALGAQAQKVMAQARAEKQAAKDAGGSNKSSSGSNKPAKRTNDASNGAKPKPKPSSNTSSKSNGSNGSGGASGAQAASKKKKNRPRRRS